MTASLLMSRRITRPEIAPGLVRQGEKYTPLLDFSMYASS
jgi:hypothetical protein